MTLPTLCQSCVYGAQYVSDENLNYHKRNHLKTQVYLRL